MEDKFTRQEEKLRELSDKFSLEVNTDELWGHVESQLPPVEDERRRPLIWWFTGMLTVAIISIALWTANSSHVNPKVQILANNQEEKAYSGMVSNVLSSENDDNEIHLETNSENLKDRSVYAINKSTSIVRKKKPVRSVDQVAGNNERTNNPDIRDNAKTIDENEITDVVETKHEEFYRESESQRDSKVEILSFPLLNSRILTKITSETDPWNDFDELKPSTPIVVEPTQKKVWLPYFAISGGVNFHQSEVSSSSNEEIDLNQFSNEKPVIGFSSRFKLGIEENTGWRIGLGISHLRLASQFSQNETVISSQEIPGTVATKIDDEGNVTNISGNLTQTTINNYNIQWFRVHDLLNLEINVGKQIFQKGKFSMSSEAHIAKNIWSSHQGYYFSEGDETITKFNSGDDSPYVNSGYSVGFGIDVEYRFSRCGLTIHPYYNLGLNSMTDEANYYQIKNSQYGIQLGIVYRP